MERKKASDFDQELINLYDRYAHGGITRREFLDGAAKFAVGGLTAAMLLESLSPNFALAQQVPKEDPRLKSEYVEYQSPKGSGKVRAYLSRPSKSGGKLPGVVVVHENRGLNPHIEDVARRLGVAGYLAMAPDGLTSAGGYPGDEDKGRDLFSKMDSDKMFEDFMAAAGHLKSHAESSGKVGVVGFCYGGGVANKMAVRLPDLAAAVAYYGSQPPAADVPKIKAPLMLHYAGLDERINAGWPAYEAALKANNIKHQAFVYDGANHAFNNDTTPRYDKAAATSSWDRTLQFFDKNLKS
jgi:carboxymethylenebutenolidase